MGVESWVFNEEEKKKKKITEKQEKANQRKILEHKKIKEEIIVEEEVENDIFHLKELVERWIITEESAKKVVEWKDLDEKTIKEIFEKIDNIEEIKDIDQYIPQNLRVSHADYDKALHDDIFRVKIITKLDSALIILARQINPNSEMWLNIFSGFLSVLDKNLIKVQEHTIDIKDSLKEIDEKKFWKKDNPKTIWEKIISFIKEIFTA